MEKQLVLENKNNQHLVVDSDIKIITKENSDNVLIVDLKGSLDIMVNVEMADNSKLVLFYNNSTNELKINEYASINKNCQLKVAYCELESKRVDRLAQFNLNKENAQIIIIGSSVVNENKHYDLTCTHKAKHTISEIETYGIVLNNGKYFIKANGEIKKGSSSSKSHQTSRVLTFGSKENATVLPLLLIDENDVEASHATSIGQLDENQLYYLQSRGLSENEALRLMSLGYLLPLTKVTEDIDLKKDLTELIERKVSESCLI